MISNIHVTVKDGLFSIAFDNRLVKNLKVDGNEIQYMPETSHCIYHQPERGLLSFAASSDVDLNMKTSPTVKLLNSIDGTETYLLAISCDAKNNGFNLKGIIHTLKRSTGNCGPLVFGDGVLQTCFETTHYNSMLLFPIAEQA